MNQANDDEPLLIRYKGRQELATYHESPLDYERHNPYIEALRPQLRYREEIANYMTVIPPYPVKYQSLSPELRISTLSRLSKFLQPNEHHIKLFRNINTMIREGYLGRNPKNKVPLAEREAKIANAVQAIMSTKEDDNFDLEPSALSTSLFGISRMGKSFTLHHSLDFNPQIIYHNFYEGEKFTRTQFVWIHLDCPKNGSLRTLVFTLMRLVDLLASSHYYRDIGRSGRATDPEVNAGLLSFLPELGLGLLAIDELQYLQAILSAIRKIRKELKQSKTKMTDNLLHTIVTLDNIFGIPEAFIGTPPAKQVISTRFHVLTRSERIGNPDWLPLKENSEDWADFVKALCDFPLLKKETDPGVISHELHLNSYGIPGVAVVVFRATHEYLFDQEVEELKPAMFGKTMKYFPKLGEAIKNLQSVNDLSALELMDDVLNLTDDDDGTTHQSASKDNGARSVSDTPKDTIASSDGGGEHEDKTARHSKRNKKNKPLDLDNDLKDADEFLDE